MSQFEWSLTFKAIVDNQSLVKAADQIGVNASAVSKQLTKLEESLGVQLLNRTTRRIALTEAGKGFYEKVTRLEYEWRSTLDEASNLAADVKGIIRIAAPQPLFSRFLMPVLADFQRLYPEISYELLHHQIDQLPSIHADLSICREIEDYDSNSIVMVPFYSYHNQLFASAEYVEKHSSLNEITQLRHQRCLVYSDKKYPLEWVFERETVALKRVLYVNSAEIMISAAKNSLGIVYLPKEILLEELDNKTLVHVLPELQSPRHRACVYYPKADFVPKKVRVLIDFLKKNRLMSP